MKNLTRTSPDVRRIFEAQTGIRKFSRGDIIYFQGDRPDCFYYLKKGRVRVYMISVDGMERTLSLAEQGEILGEAAFFDNMPRMSCAAALTAAEVISIDRARLLSLVREFPELALSLLEIQAKRVRELSSQLDSMTFLQAEGRIARLLLRSSGDSAEPVRLTHESIADSVGVSRVTVSKTLGSLATRGIIRTGYGSITILDREELEKISEKQK